MKTITHIVAPVARRIVSYQELTKLLYDFQDGKITRGEAVWVLESWVQWTIEDAIAWGRKNP